MAGPQRKPVVLSGQTLELTEMTSGLEAETHTDYGFHPNVVASEAQEEQDDHGRGRAATQWASPRQDKRPSQLFTPPPSNGHKKLTKKPRVSKKQIGRHDLHRSSTAHLGESIQAMRSVLEWVDTNIHTRSECRRFMPAKAVVEPVDESGDEPSGGEYYIPDSPNLIKCVCGLHYYQHTVKPPPGSLYDLSDPWSTLGCTSESRADAVGVLDFHRTHEAPYLKLASTTKAATMLSFLHDKLGLEYPQLLISVTGGAQDFDLPPRLETVIKRGLVKAAEATSTWVVTGGTHCGIMKYVGEAFHANEEKPVTLIGLASWGIVHNKQDLMLETDLTALTKYMATLDNTEENRELAVTGLRKAYKSSTHRALDHNHTHFFLVDDGTQNYGAEIALRAKFEQEVVKQDYDRAGDDEMYSDHTIYSVLLVVGGGKGTIRQAYHAVQCNTPVVVVSGSGNAANLLSFAWNFLHAESLASTVFSGEELRRRVRQAFPNFETEDLRSMTKMILDTVMVKNKIIIFKLSEGKERDIDEALLQGIMSRMDLHGRKGQELAMLQLAMRWNRIDLATKQLDNIDKKRFKEDLNGMLIWALKNNRKEFVELLVPQVNIRDFVYGTAAGEVGDLSTSRLEALYWHSLKTNTGEAPYFRRLIAMIPRNKVNWWHHVFKSQPRNLMEKVDHCILALIFHNDTPDPTPRHKVKNDELGAHHDLMTWCCLMNHFSMAKYFWQQGGHSIPNALVASRIFFAMSKHKALTALGQFQESRQKMVRMSKKFEVLATGVLDMCMQEHADKANKILRLPLDDIRLLKRKKQKAFDCIQLAVEADNREFLSHPAVQSVLDSEWHGDMSPSTSNFKIVINLLLNLPFLFFPITLLINGLLFRIKIRGEQEYLHYHGIADNRHKITSKARILAFMGAPITKFWLKVLSFLAFLAVFTAVTLVPLTEQFSVLEFVVLIWMVTLVLEEYRQFYISGWQTYWSDFWNQWDILVYASYFLGVMTTRWVSVVDPTAYHQRVAKLMYTITLVALFPRALHIYEVNPVMGPKLIIIFRMMSDLATFGALLIVFLLQYGIAAQALLYPERYPDSVTLQGIFFRPYFQLYGELLLDDMAAETECVGPWPFDSCGDSFGYVSVYLLGLYMVIANIMLLNLLIAMFTRTYEEVQQEAQKLWRFQWYKLLNEYQTQPYLPPPLVILSHLHRAVRWCRRRMTTVEKSPVDDRDRRMLERFQERHTEFFLHKQEKDRLSTDQHILRRMDTDITRLNNSVYEVRRVCDQLRRLSEKQESRLERLAQQQGVRDLDDGSFADAPQTRTPKHITQDMQDHVLTYNKYVRASLAYPEAPDRAHIPAISDSDWDKIQSAQVSLGSKISYYIDESDPGSTKTFDDRLVVCWSFQVSSWKNDGEFTSRTQRKNLIRRVPVPDSKLSWDVDFPEYEPLYYTSPYSIFFSRDGPCPNWGPCLQGKHGWHQWADEEIRDGKATDGDPGAVQSGGTKRVWNVQDGRINRVSHICTYKLDAQGLPRNPVGRTGIAGRGVLGKWGPNHAVDPIMTRWKRSKAGIIVERDGKKVLEFVAVRRKSGGMWALPGGFIDDGHGVSKALRKEFGEEALDSMNLHPAAKKTIQEDLKTVFSNGEEIYRGYSDDDRNTDNAWVETLAVNFHDSVGKAVSSFRLKAGDDAGDVAWVMLHRDLDLFANHVEILHKVSKLRKAYW